MSASVSPIERALHRAAMYRLCGAALAYPGPGRLAAIATLAERVATSARGELRTLVGSLARVAREADEPAVAADYVSLFDGATRCAPYEGAYGLPRMGGKSALLADIAAFYVAFGLEPSHGQADAEDHIASELELMSALALKEAWARAESHHERAEISESASSAFLGDHLARWAPSFVEALQALSAEPYYAAVAALLGAWVAADAADLGVRAATIPRTPADPAEAEAFGCPMAPEPAD
jgi:TorA maturation chaperone TorD